MINSVALGMLMVMVKWRLLLADTTYDGARNVAQLIEWNGANLAVEDVTGWYWTGNTVINSVAIGDVDGDGQVGDCYWWVFL